MPFITEELWKSHFDASSSLIFGPWPQLSKGLTNVEAEAEMDWVVRLVSHIRALRSEMNVSPGAKIQLLIKGANEVTEIRLETHRSILLSLARLSSLEVLEGVAPKGSVQDVIDEATIILPLDNIIDVESEAARLKKEIAKLEGDIAKHDKKLANKGFMEKAPAAIIEIERQRRDEESLILEKLIEALARLKAL